MTKSKLKANFVAGEKGLLYQVSRQVTPCLGVVLYISPLFESVNQVRHVYTKSASENVTQGFSSLIYDHFGCGDSQGELLEATFSLWQDDLLTQIMQLKRGLLAHQSLTLVAFSSAALLLNAQILQHVDSVQLWQPEINGEKYVKQFKRLQLLESSVNTHLPDTDIEISGYLMKKTLLAEIKAQNLAVSMMNCPLHWLEILADNQQHMLPSRAKEARSIVDSAQLLVLNDSHFWQTSDLQIPLKLIRASNQLLEVGNA